MIHHAHPKLLQIQHLTKEYAPQQGLWDLNLEINVPSCTILTGSCGSGKSLLLRLIAKLEQPNAGLIHYDNKKPVDNIAFMMQETHMQLLGNTVLEEIELFSILAGKSAEEVEIRTEKAINLFGLRSILKQHPLSLSGGQKRQVLLAGLSTQDASLFLLDEPFANLDYPSIRQVRSAIEILLSQGKTVLIATHEIEKILTLATHLIILHNGRLCYQGECSTLSQARKIPWEQYDLKNPFDPALQW
ncbi:ABC transporter ATP-binding protein [Entomospira entomophila]|uniref:ABC transporter ATP-binding protein n=1 Tax=Entomospira entomophila TaxID=2719988 RepID=A0A968GA16_9SPIO|nr:ABC transporter ATP-binding protein [Entomospira entomophilus]NIZ40570.1 ABC transporter ATP-binding protein [Entomospira entomophilus]WDI36128.1 ABC transporter ATP-binding protein [Entomospira entomophilus]